MDCANPFIILNCSSACLFMFVLILNVAFLALDVSPPLLSINENDGPVIWPCIKVSASSSLLLSKLLPNVGVEDISYNSPEEYIVKI